MGKSIKADGTSKCFGFSYCYDEKSKRRIFEVLKSQGMQMNQQVTFISDGDEIRALRKIQGDYPACAYVFESNRHSPLAKDTMVNKNI